MHFDVCILSLKNFTTNFTTKTEMVFVKDVCNFLQNHRWYLSKMFVIFWFQKNVCNFLKDACVFAFVVISAGLITRDDWVIFCNDVFEAR